MKRKLEKEIKAKLKKLENQILSGKSLGKVRPISLKKPLLSHNLKIDNTVLKYDKTINNITLQDFSTSIIEQKFVKYEDGVIGIQVSNQPKSGFSRILQLSLRMAYGSKNASDITNALSTINDLLTNNVKKQFDVLHKNRGVYVFFTIKDFLNYFIKPILNFVFKHKDNIFTGRIPIFANALEAFCRHIVANKFYASDTPNMLMDKEDLAILVYGISGATATYKNDKNMINKINDVKKDYACFNILTDGLIELLTKKNIESIITKYQSLEKNKSFTNFYRHSSSLKNLKKQIKKGISKAEKLVKDIPAKKLKMAKDEALSKEVKRELEKELTTLMTKELETIKKKKKKIKTELDKTKKLVKDVKKEAEKKGDTKAEKQAAELTKKIETTQKEIKDIPEKPKDIIPEKPVDAPPKKEKKIRQKKEKIKKDIKDTQKIIEEIKDAAKETGDKKTEKQAEKLQKEITQTEKIIESIPVEKTTPTTTELTKEEEKITKQIEKEKPDESSELEKKIALALENVAKSLDKITDTPIETPKQQEKAEEKTEKLVEQAKEIIETAKETGNKELIEQAKEIKDTAKDTLKQVQNIEPEKPAEKSEEEDILEGLSELDDELKNL